MALFAINQAARVQHSYWPPIKKKNQPKNQTKSNKTHTISPPQISKQKQTKLPLIKPNPQKICPPAPTVPSMLSI